MHRACERLQIHRGAGGCGAGHRASEGRVLFTVSIAASPRVASRKGPEGVIALKGVGVILHAVFFNRFASRSSYLLKLVSPAMTPAAHLRFAFVL
jgi:hypothetical protein